MKKEAKRLYHIFLTCQPDKYLAKQATLFCVDEMIEEADISCENSDCQHETTLRVKDLKEVKQEIEKL